MKIQVLFTALSVALLPGSSLRAQTSVLVAGWDFNSLNSAGLQAVQANYADAYSPKAPADTDLAYALKRGTFLANGSSGSDLLPLSAGTGVSISNTPDTIDRAITSRSSGGGRFFDNAYTGTNDNAIQVATSSALTPQTFAFKLDTTGVRELTLSLWLAKSSAQNLTIEWSYQVGTGAIQSAGITTNLSAAAANAYANTIVDFSSFAALGNQASVSLIGAVKSTSTSPFGLRIDNTGVYGTLLEVASAIAFWKGGAGAWNATATDWKDEPGTASAAWTSGTAVFRPVTGATPGTVTVESAGVTFKGIQFSTTGYTVAGGNLTTAEAATPLKVGDGTAGGAAISATISAPIVGTGGIDKTDLGTLTLSGANTYAGNTTVTAGTLKVDGNQTAAAGAVSVASGATLGGVGTLGGNVTVQGGAILSGAAGSTLTLAKDLVLNPTSLVNVTLGAPATTELFKVKGSLTLDGTLNVTGTTGFGAGLYRLISYDGALTNNTLAAGTVPTGFTAEVQTSVANQVNAVFTTGSTPPPAGAKPMWAGGAGTWSAATTSTGWKTVDGATAGAWDGGQAIFTGTAGTVTVDNAAGAVTFTGLQLANTGYTIAGGTLTTTTATTELRVGDGTAAGAAMTGTISSVIAGSGGVNKVDTGTLTLSGANSYTGATTVTAGTLKLDGNQTAATGAVSVASGATLGGTGTTGGAVNVQAGGILSGATGSTLTMAGLSLNATSALNVTLGAPGTQELFKVNGPLTLDGILNVTGGGGFGAGLYRIINYTGALTDNGLTAGTVPSGFTAQIQTSVANQVNAVFAAGTTPPPAGPSGAALPMWAGGSGTWTAATTSTSWKSVSGTESGAWMPGQAIFAGTAGTVTVANAAGAVEFTGLQLANTGYTIAGGTLTTTTLATPVRVGDGTAAGAAMSGTISAVIAGGGGIEKTDLGTLILSGANTYTGGTTVTAGTVQLGAGGTTGSLAGNITNSGTVSFNRSDAVTYAGVISGPGAVTQAGGGTTVFTGNHNYTGGTNINAGTLQLGAGGTTGSVAGNIVNQGTLTLNRSDALALGGAISGGGAVVQEGRGTTTLTGANTYTGATTVNAGTLLIDGTQAAATGAVTVAAGGALGGAGTTGGSITVAAGGTLVVASGRTLATTGALTLDNASQVNVALGAPTTKNMFQVGGALTLDGVLNVSNAGGLTSGTYRLADYAGTLTNNTLVIGNAAVNPGDLAIQITPGNPINLVVAPTVADYWAGGNGTWTAAGTSTAWQKLDATGAGAWQGRTATFGGTAGTVTVDNAAGAVNLAGAQFLTTGYTVTGGTLTTATAATAIQVGDASTAGAATAATISSVIAGTGGVNKTDLGTLTLTAANTYTGATTVSGGTLLVNGTQAASAVTVASGARLGGTGSLGGVTVANGGTLLGAAGGTLTMTGLTLNPDSRLGLTLGAPSTTGLFQVNGNLTLDGTLDVTSAPGFGAGLYRVFNYTGSLVDNGLQVGALPSAAYVPTVQTSVANQVNLLVGVGALPIWAGGSGTWSASATGTGFSSADGVVTGGAWQPGMAVFQGTAGTVTVDNTAGPVAITGLQLATTGYTVTGGALTITGAATSLRVGDGTAAGGAMTGTIASEITGAGGVEKNDLGTLILSGNNTYTGGTTVAAGTLQIGAGGTTGSVAGNIANSGTVKLNRSNEATYAGAISGSGAVVQAGSGTTVLTGTHTYTGGTTVSAGTLQLGDGGSTGSVAGNIANSGTVSFKRSNEVTFAGIISGSGAVAQAGTGTTVLTGNNTYTGGTTVAAGTLQLGAGGTTGGIAGNIANSGTVKFNRSNEATFAGVISGSGAVEQTGGGTTVLTGNNTYTGGTTIAAGTLQLGAGGTSGGLTGNVANNGTLAINRSDAVTLAGVVSGTGALRQAGGGTTTLTAANTYTGGTTIAAGTLQLGDGGASGSLTGNVANAGTLAINRSDALTLPGVVSGAGALRHRGPGTTTLTAANTYTGGTTIAAGTLQVGAGGTAGSLTGNVTNSGTLAINRSDAVTLPGVVSGTGALRQVGAGTTTLTGANTYTGGTTVAAGTLQIGDGGTTGSLAGNIANAGTVSFKRSNAVTFAGAISGSGAVAQAGSGTTILTGTNTYTGGTTIGAGTLQLGDGGTGGSLTGPVANSGTLAIKRSDAVTLDGAISGSGALRQLGGGTTILTGANTYAGGTTISAGTLQLGAGGAGGSLTGNVTNNAALAVNRSDALTLAGVVSGNGTLTQAGPGTTILTGNSTYTGGTTIGAGTLQLGAGGAAGAITGNVVNHGTLAINRSDAVTLDGIISGTGGFTQAGAGTTTLTAANTYAGSTTINAGTLQLGSGGTSGAVVGNIVNNGALALNRSDAIVIGNAISGTGAVVKLGNGTTTLAGINSYTGGTTITAGVLEVADNANLGGAAGGVTLNGGTLRAGAGLTMGRNIAVSAGGGTLDTGANILTVQGALTGTGNLTKTGTGQLTLAGNGSHTGTTSISQGAIFLNAGSLGAANIAAGARLTGIGTIRGNLANAGQLSPGASPGTITVTGNFTQAATGTLTIELASATSFDSLAITGTATLGGTLAVSGLNGFVPQAGQTFPIIDAAGGVSGKFATVSSPWGTVSPMLKFEALYGTKEVRLSMTQLPFAGVKGTPNQIAIGKGVDGAIALGAIPNLQKALNALPSTERVASALDELSPLRFERWYQQGVYNAGRMIQTAEARLDQAMREPRGSVWAEVVGRQSTYDAGTDGYAGDATSSGITVGADARLNPDLHLGLIFGYTGEDMRLDAAGSRTDGQRFSGAVYARYDPAPWYVETVLGVTHTELSSRRVVTIPGIAGIANAETNSQDQYGSVRAGWTMAWNRMKLTPYVAGDYVRWSADPTVETGAGDANLRLHGQRSDSLASRAGFSVAFPYLDESVSFVPRIDLAWRHEFRDTRPAISAELGGSPFTVQGGLLPGAASPVGLGAVANAVDARTNGITAGLGVDVTFGAWMTAYLRVSTEWSTAATRAVEARAGTEFRF